MFEDMNPTTVPVVTLPAVNDSGNICGYRVSKHAEARMAERRVAPDEVSTVFKSDETCYEVDCAGVAQYRGSVQGRAIRVTVNELANVIITVAAPAPWFLLSASEEYGF